jgi:hypothetical protein
MTKHFFPTTSVEIPGLRGGEETAEFAGDGVSPVILLIP